jgi:hypothetical protein
VQETGPRGTQQCEGNSLSPADTISPLTTFMKVFCETVFVGSQGRDLSVGEFRRQHCWL